MYVHSNPLCTAVQGEKIPSQFTMPQVNLIIEHTYNPNDHLATFETTMQLYEVFDGVICNKFHVTL